MQVENFNCTPIRGVSLAADGKLEAAAFPSQGGAGQGTGDLSVPLAGGWRNLMANRVMRSLGIPLVSTWNESLPMWPYHRWGG